MPGKILRALVVSLIISLFAAVIGIFLTAPDMTITDEMTKTIADQVLSFAVPIFIGCVLIMIWQSGNRYRKTAKAFAVAFVTGLATAILRMLDTSTSLTSENLLSLQSDMLVLEFFTFAAPVFIACLLFSFWQTRAEDGGMI